MAIHTNPSNPTVLALVLPATLASVGDPDGTRTITSIVALLVVLGLGLVMLAVWLFKVTRPDPEVLTPLEVMGERRWRRADPVWQRRRLDEVRPVGAQPLQPSVAPPALDATFDDGPAASGFDDLHDDALPPDVPRHTVAEPVPAADGATAIERGPHDDPDDDQPDDDQPDDDEPLVESEPAPRPSIVVSTAPQRKVDPGPTDQSSTPIDPLLAARFAAQGAATPPGLPRPLVGDLPDRELDPALMANAMAETEAELAHRHERGHDQDA